MKRKREKDEWKMTGRKSKINVLKVYNLNIFF